MNTTSPVRDDASRRHELLSSASSLEGVLRRLPRWQRSEALEEVARHVEQEAAAFSHAIVTEGIKTPSEADREVSRCTNTLRLCASAVGEPAGEVIPFDQVASGEGRHGWWVQRPLGVVLAVTPYNDPLNLVAHKIGPAIAAGAPVILVPHLQTPTPARMLVEAFAETQLPRGAVSLLLGGAEDVLALAADDRVRVVSFTGGRKAGAAIATAAAGKRLILELGGVCCAYVAADADLNRAADALASGMTWAAGQNCLHTQRVFAHVDIYQELASKLVSRLENWGVTGEGCGSPIAPLSDHARRETATASMHSAIASGATLLSGGSFSGRRMAPVLLAGVPENHPLCREEVFAPLATIDKVGSYEEAASRINACGPAINAALFTNQMDLILRAQDELQAGAIIVNDSTDFRIDAMPFGGDGAAGLGREGVRSTIAEMCSPRLLCLRS